MPGSIEALRALHEGVPVPERGIRVPWLIRRPELLALIPEAEFAMSPAGWPLLRFTLLGFAGIFGFNFVSHPERRLLIVEFDNEDEETRGGTFARASVRLREHLGVPNAVDNPWQQRWNDGRLKVFNRISTGWNVRQEREGTSHTLCVYAAFGAAPA